MYNPKQAVPISDDLNISSDNLDEFLGFDLDSDYDMKEDP